MDLIGQKIVQRQILLDMKTVTQFQQYAEKSLNRHMTELSVKYQNKTIDKDTKLQAFKNHRLIFDNELSEEIQSLVKSENNPWLMAELEEVKRTFIGKFNMDRLY